jgi:hypothetical protein
LLDVSVFFDFNEYFYLNSYGFGILGLIFRLLFYFLDFTITGISLSFMEFKFL